jgi:hypothetical protein
VSLTTHRDVLDRRPPADTVRFDVVKLQKGGALAASASPADEGAATAIPPPDRPCDIGRDDP